MRNIGDLPPIEEVPAAHLSGRSLGNGWMVGQRVTRDPGTSGGAFSVSYTATHVDGREGFLKALNFAAASVGSGTLADRVNQFTLTSFDAAWALRVSKHVIEGVEQLHLAQVAHQDLKPSNVLTQKSGAEMKLGDLGRADRLGRNGPWSGLGIPGAMVYAPPEQQYGSFTGTWEDRKAADMYLTGSLAAQLFLGHCMSAILQDRIQHEFQATVWNGTFAAAIPALKAAHALIMESLYQAAETNIGHSDMAERFAGVVSQMTHPDPASRGHPKDRRARTSSYSLRRYTGTLNTLMAQAEYRLVGRPLGGNTN